MKTKGSIIKLTLAASLLVWPLSGMGFSQETAGKPDQGVSRRGPAQDFGEALQINKRLRERYEKASPEDREQIRQRWEERKQNRAASGSPEARMQQRKQIHKDSSLRNGSGGGQNSRRGNRGGGRGGR